MREIEVPREETGLERVGPYELVAPLARGGMGQVYRACRVDTGQIVALKSLASEWIGDANAIARFDREAQTLASVAHPNVARVLDHGVAENGAPYLVMEFIDGPSVADLIRNRADLPFSRIARLMTEAALGLQAAYKERIIHRDIKPANLMLDTSDTLKIVDFGLAKNLFENTFKTSTGTVLGTPRYMAPEQGRGQSIDHRSDMYSLGASFYHLAAGQPPFEADTSFGLMMMHIQTPLTPLYVVNPLAPADLAEVIHRLLAKDPNDRYDDYDDLIRELRQIELARRAKEDADGVRVSLQAPPSEEREAPIGLDAGPSPTPSGGPALAAGRITPPADPVEPESGSLTGRLTVVAILLALGLAAATLLSPGKADASGKRHSALGQFIGRLLDSTRDKTGQGDESQRFANLRMNRDRMKTVYNMCLIYAARTGSFPHKIDDLVEAGIARPADVVDAWNRPFIIRAVTRELDSSGEDGIEHSQDDFRLRADNDFVAVPADLIEADIMAAPG